MAIDTEAKRWSMLQHAAGPSSYPLVFNPDTSGLVAIERATALKHYGGIAWADVVVVVIDALELEFTAPANRLHYTAPAGRLHWGAA